MVTSTKTTSAGTVSIGIEPTPGERFPLLDGMRAIAVLSVFALHVNNFSYPLREHWASFARHLDVGVEMFFVLSGFLIYRPFVAAHLNGTAPTSVGEYARRRIFRIYPAYLVAVLLLWRLQLVFNWHDVIVHDRASLLKQASLTWVWFAKQGGSIIGDSWTLCVEVAFYALVPLWAFVIRRTGRLIGPLRAEVSGAITLVGLGVPATFWASYWAHSGNRFLSPVPDVRVPPALLSIPAGMLLATLSVEADRSERVRKWTTRAGRAPLLWWGAAIGTYVVLSVVLVKPAIGLLPSFSATEQNWQSLLQAAIAIFVMVPAVFGAMHGRYAGVLTWRPLVYMGMVSYSFYIWHGRTFHAIGARWNDGVWPGLAWTVVAFVWSLAMATASYYVIERPFIRFGRRPLRRRVRRVVEPARS
jgi:peptidoglycan/LPS O-acetylase OafA/YrhL